MTDIKTEASQATAAAKSVVTDAAHTAQAFEQKQVGWVRRNWLALAIGFALGLVAGLLL